jgi:hypothetical protein
MNPLRVIDNIALDKDLVGFMPSGLLVMSTLCKSPRCARFRMTSGKTKRNAISTLRPNYAGTDRNDQYKVEMASVWAHENRAATGEREALGCRR